MQALVIEGIPNAFNALKSTFDVRARRQRNGMTYVVITERDDNPGPSITNCAETACPEIARRLGLDFDRCVFIEHYPAMREGGKETFDQIRFSGVVEWRNAAGGEKVRYAHLAGWRPYPLAAGRRLLRGEDLA